MKSYVSLLRLLIFAPFFLYNTSCASQKSNHNFEISGTIKGIKEGKFYVFSITTNRLDSVEIKDEKFVFKTTIDEFDIFNVGSQNASNATHRLVPAEKNAKLKLEGTGNNANQWVVKGSKEADLYETFANSTKENETLFFTTLQKNTDASGRTNLDPNQLSYVLGLLKSLNQQAYNFIDSHPSSLSAVSAIVYSLSITPPDADPSNREELGNRLAEAFSKDVASSQFGLQLQKMLVVTPASAQIAPDFSQEDVNGKPVSLSSFRGKYVLVDFWASWCRPCRMENPNVVEAYNRFKSKNFEVLGVSLDQNKMAWVNAISADKLTWSHVSDLKGFENAAARLYGVNAIPSNYLIDPNGKILAVNLRGEELIRFLEKTLK